jgi:hypothetical protein
MMCFIIFNLKATKTFIKTFWFHSVVFVLPEFLKAFEFSIGSLRVLLSSLLLFSFNFKQTLRKIR